MGSPGFTEDSAFTDSSSFTHQTLRWMADGRGTAVPMSEVLAESEAELQRVLERYVLGYVYFSMDGPSWSREFNFTSDTDACDWNSRADASIEDTPTSASSFGSGFVEAISMPGNQLRGTFPPEILYLKHLRRLDLSLNEIEGTIPTEIGQLPNLEHFSMQGTAINGTIPTEVGLLPKLKHFDLTTTGISGAIPTQIGKLGKLEALYLHDTRLMGTIPTEVGLMASLVYFHVYDTAISGEVPTQMSALVRLVEFEFQNTHIEGNVDPLFCSDADGSANPTNLRSDCQEAGVKPRRVICSCCSTCDPHVRSYDANE